MGATAAIATLAVVGAAAGAGSAYMDGKSQRDQMKQQYRVDEYNAQMEKMETEVDLARQEKLLQKQLAESMATSNNLFGEAGLNPFGGSAGNIMEGVFQSGQDETRTLKAQEKLAQNKYITTSAMRRKAFNQNMRNNAISTGINVVSGAISGGASGYTAGNGMFGK